MAYSELQLLLNTLINSLNNSSNQIKVEPTFKGQMGQINQLLKNDRTAIISPILDFMIRAANTTIEFDASRSSLKKLFDDWQKNVNKNLNIDIPKGLRSFGEQYYRERWKSSFLVLRVNWGNVDGWILPTEMWFMDGASIVVENESGQLDQNIYSFNGKPLKPSDDHSIIIRKPYNQLYDQYPTPYLVHRGALDHALRKWNIIDRQNQMIATAFPYQLLLKLGSDTLLSRGIVPDEKILTEQGEKFKKIKQAESSHEFATGSVSALPHYANIEELIPDFGKIMDQKILLATDRDILSTMGMIELKGFSSTREEAILNPKVLVEEVVDAVQDYAELLNEIVDLIKEKNSNKYGINDKVVIQPGIIKAFLTKEDKQMIRGWWDRGVVGDKSALESTTDLLFEKQVKERDYERKEGLDLRMFPRVVQNQDNGLNDTPDQENVPDDKKGPEKNNYKNAKQIQSDIDKANELYNKLNADIVICQNCGEKISYLEYPEVRMGYIKCPNCGGEIDQEGKCYLNEASDKNSEEYGEEIEEAIEQQYLEAPYKDNQSLPKNITNTLPTDAQTVWRTVFNNSLDNGDTEDIARKKAWAAVKRGWKKNKDGNWVKK